MADYRGGGLTNMKIREAEKLVENIRHNVEQKKKEAEGAVSKFLFAVQTLNFIVQENIQTESREMEDQLNEIPMN